MRVRCANRNCGLIYDDEKGHLVHLSKTVTEVHCPRCDGSEYYNLKPGEVEKPKTGAQLIALERIRQTKVLGWTAEHDDGHEYGDMRVVAAVLATDGTDASVTDALGRGTGTNPWGLEKKYGYQYGGDEIAKLVVAGALIAAEIDRKQRLKAKAAKEVTP